MFSAGPCFDFADVVAGEVDARGGKDGVDLVGGYGRQDISAARLALGRATVS